MGTINSFWQFVRHYANKKVRQTSKLKFDLRCQCCKSWMSEGYPQTFVRYENDNQDFPVTICARCKKESIWVDHGIVWESYEKHKK